MSNPIFPVVGRDWSSVSSVFGKRSSPGGIGSTNHKGIDIAAPTGTGVVAPVSGTVTYAGTAKGFGNYVTVQGNDGYTYQFGHLNTIGVRTGQNVTAGSGLGTVGSTGNSTGPHLHFGIKDQSGTNLNPASILQKGAGLVNAGKTLIDKADKIAKAVIPGYDQARAVTDAIGITGDCDWFCKLKNWINDSGFFQRIAIAILAFIIIAGAVFAIKSRN